MGSEASGRVAARSPAPHPHARRVHGSRSRGLHLQYNTKEETSEGGVAQLAAVLLLKMQQRGMLVRSADAAATHHQRAREGYTTARINLAHACNC